MKFEMICQEIRMTAQTHQAKIKWFSNGSTNCYANGDGC